MNTHPLLTPFTRRLSSRFADGIGKSVELGLVGDIEFEGLVLLQQILREDETQSAGLLRELPQPLLALLIEEGTAAHETVVALLQEHTLLGSELAVMVVDILYAGEELWIQTDVVGVARENWTHLLSQSLEVVVALSTEQIEEYRRHTVEEVVVVLTALYLVLGDNRILERRLIGIINNAVDTLVVAADAFIIASS